MTDRPTAPIDQAELRACLPAAAAARVQSLRVGDAAVSVVLDGTGLSAAAGATLEGEVRTALERRAGMPVRVGVMGERPAAAAPAPPAVADAHQTPPIIAIASGKGGVGKSTLSANLAVALARAGRKVGLVDADIYGPSQPRLLGLEGTRPEAHDQRLIPVPSRYGVPLLSMGQLVEPGRAVAWRGSMAGGALGQLIGGHWDAAEMLIVDLPPGTGDIQLTMVQKHKPAGAVIVSTPQDLALIDATRAIQLFETVGVPIIGLVENMAGYACPHCGEISDPFGSGGVEAAARAMGHDFLGRVPLTLAIRQASDAGEPPAAGDGPESAAFAAIAARVAGWFDAR